jgi:RNA polymerase sigma-70 factor (ECF subfamily)
MIGPTAPLHTSADRVDSTAWIAALRSDGRSHEEALSRLHELLLQAARFEVARRRARLPRMREEHLDDLAASAADDSLLTVLERLDEFRGSSRFTTWASKFALREASVRLRRSAWRDREVVDGPQRWASAPGSAWSVPHERELVATIRDCIACDLTFHQRQVLVAVAIDGVPLDVLAVRFFTTRGALYETLREARHLLRGRSGGPRLRRRGLPRLPT